MTFVTSCIQCLSLVAINNQLQSLWLFLTTSSTEIHFIKIQSNLYAFSYEINCLLLKFVGIDCHQPVYDNCWLNYYKFIVCDVFFELYFMFVILFYIIHCSFYQFLVYCE